MAEYTIKVRRFQPESGEGPYWEEFGVDLEPSLSVLDELRFLRQSCHDVALDDLLAMGTIHAARALGVQEEVGSLIQGKWADMAVFPLEHATSPDGWADVLQSTKEPIAVFVDGRQTI